MTGSRAAEVREHIAACAECSQRAKETQKLSDTLGLWEVETTERDIADGVAARVEDQQTQAWRSPSTHARIKKLLPQVLRVAASIIIAIGLGHKLGEYSVEGGKPQATSSQKPEYLAALGLEWSSGLVWLVLEGDQADAGAEQ